MRIGGLSIGHVHTCAAGGGAGGLAFLALISWIPGAIVGGGTV